MLPDWLGKRERDLPPGGSDVFIIKSLQAVGKVLAGIQVQRGQERGRTLPPLWKLLLVLGGVLLLSLTQNRLVLMAYGAGVLLVLSSLPALNIAGILKGAAGGAACTGLLLVPAWLLNSSLQGNGALLVIKVFLSVLTVGIFNHTTQWNHITGALRRLHVPGLCIFVLDISLKYIVLLGNWLTELLRAVQLRSLGKNREKYRAAGGVMGTLLLRGTELNRQLYEAMRCRCFTDDYEGL